MRYLKCLALISIFSSVFGASINGIDNKEILELIKSQLSNWDDVSKESISREFKLKKDKLIIKKILNSYGYFDAEVTSPEQNDKIVFNITLNERYTFDDVLLIYADQRSYRSGLTVGQVFDLINIEYNSYTDTKQLADGKNNIEDFLKNKGFAFVKINSPKVEIDKEEKTIKAIYKIVLNGKTIIDKTIIDIKSHKDPKLLEPFIRNRIDWKDGDVYAPQKIENLKESLMSSDIFSGIEVTLSDPIIDPKDSTLSHTTITINIEENLLRNVEAGVNYGTSEKVGVLFSWTNYNIDGKGSKLSTKANWSKETKELKLKYTVYDLFYRKQKLSNQISYFKEDTSSYDVKGFKGESMLWQTFGTKFQLGVGVCAENSKTQDKIINETSEIKNVSNSENAETKSNTRTSESKDKATNTKLEKVKFNAVGIHMGLNFDTTSDYLNPQSGLRCSADVVPYLGKNITVFLGKASFYIPIKQNSFKNRAVLAFYSKFGTVFRKNSQKIPRDKLFFSGGSNSVRGYGYQKIGNVNDDKKPLGGESVFEIGIEPRLKINDNIGIVAFLEGGNVYTTKLPRPWKKMFWGYGFGIRYYTPIGPIRLDIGFPTKKRKTSNGKKIDDDFNIYISVGQAF